MPVDKPVLKIAERPKVIPFKAVLQGPAGSGKSISAAALGKVFAGSNPYLVLSSEPNAPFMYDKLFGYQTMVLESQYPDYIYELLLNIQEQGYNTVIIDSISAEWNGDDGMLTAVDQMKNAKGGSEIAGAQAWGKHKPVHNKLFRFIMESPMHIICTCQVKDKLLIKKNEETKKTEYKTIIGAPIQSPKQLDVFDTNIVIGLDGVATVMKNRVPKEMTYLAESFNVPVKDDVAWQPNIESTADFAKRMKKWLKLLVAENPQSVAAN